MTETTVPTRAETVVARLPGGRDYRVERAEDGTSRLLARPIATGDSEAPRLAEVRRQVTKGLTR